jgi:hypothetical protein
MMKLIQEPHETLTFSESTDRTFTTADELHEFWNEQTKLSAQQRKGDDSPEMPPPGPDGRNQCDCYYRIIDITVPAHDPNAHDTSLTFASGSWCNPTGVQTIFSRDHYATGQCTPFPSGATPLPNLNPDPFELIPFNCGLMPRYWQGGSPFFAYIENTVTCLDANSVSTADNVVSLTFQIICSDVIANPDLPNDCDDVQDGINGHSFASPIVTLEIIENGKFVYTDFPLSLEYV